jgi:hypothetical protein
MNLWPPEPGRQEMHSLLQWRASHSTIYCLLLRTVCERCVSTCSDEQMFKAIKEDGKDEKDKIKMKPEGS